MDSPPEPRAASGMGRRRWRPMHYIQARPRLAMSMAIFAAVSVLLALGGMPPAPALLLGFDLAALIYLVAIAWMFAHADHEDMNRQARLQDTGRRGTLAMAILVSLVVLVALATELRASKNGGGVPAVGLAAASVVLSWLFMNTTFALHYAHTFYGDGRGPRGGLEFPATPEPDYWDFAYFSFVVGMCFQVSDVTVSGRHMRHITLLHSVVAFFFNVVILAISVSVVGGLA